MLGDVNKLFVFKSLLTMPSNILLLHLKETFPPIIWIFTEGEGDGIKSSLPFKIFSALNGWISEWVINLWFLKLNNKTVFLDKILLFPETPNLYENNHYHEECLKCNSCGMNLSGPNQKRARRFKNHILCDLHFADMALMESSDFMQQLRNFKPQVCT